MKKVKKAMKWVLIALGALVVVQLGFFIHATTSPQWKYAKQALINTRPNYDLRYCVDLPADARKDFTNTSWKPMPCINTATSFYNPTHRAGNCNKFKDNPAQWGFREVSASEAVPGDLMVFFRRKDGARHAGVYTMNSPLGPLCGNTTLHGIYWPVLPVYPLLAINAVGFYKVKYYRYNG